MNEKSALKKKTIYEFIIIKYQKKALNVFSYQ